MIMVRYSTCTCNWLNNPRDPYFYFYFRCFPFDCMRTYHSKVAHCKVACATCTCNLRVKVRNSDIARSAS